MGIAEAIVNSVEATPVGMRTTNVCIDQSREDRRISKQTSKTTKVVNFFNARFMN